MHVLVALLPMNRYATPCILQLVHLDHVAPLGCSAYWLGLQVRSLLLTPVLQRHLDALNAIQNTSSEVGSPCFYVS